MILMQKASSVVVSCLVLLFVAGASIAQERGATTEPPKGVLKAVWLEGPDWKL